MSSNRKLQVPLVFARQPKIQADAFGMPDVQIPIRLRRKPRLHTPAKAAVAVVLFDNFFNEIQRPWFVGLITVFLCTKLFFSRSFAAKFFQLSHQRHPILAIGFLFLLLLLCNELP